ncbi:MAG: DUF368 domain-containing protein [Bacteroides sp.]|nr:DUF368 domain-containing protein [Bacteroides sp.]
MKKNLGHYGLVALKGIAMGAADVVPGVSGGTIAFIAGIYDELIDSIKSVNLANLKLLFTGKFRAFWKAVNGNFLLSLIVGIGISIFSLARVITVLLHEYPVLVFAFFFGLIVASAWFVSRDIREWNWKTVSGLIVGIVLAVWVTSVTAAQTPESLWFVFLCGFVAICAMILPGISGSFILLLMGKYEYIMEAVKNLDASVLGVFAVGAVVGIASFARLLSFALRRFRAMTLAVLTGFIIGSLNKVWPWKETVHSYVDSHGVEKPLVESNILPDAFVWQAVLLMLAGFFLVWGLERLSGRKPVGRK